MRKSVCFLALFLCLSLLPLKVKADSSTFLSQTKLSDTQKEDKVEPTRFTSEEMPGGGTLVVISPLSLPALPSYVSTTIRSTHQQYEELVGPLPPVDAVVKFLNEELFYKTTAAPRWTNALFFRGQILLPLAKDTVEDQDNLKRSLKHEYSHAVLHAITNGKCPGWFDEGFAQLAEGPELLSLKRALKSWLATKDVVSFRSLKGGFTRLNPEMVPPAYAQSLYASRFLRDSQSASKIRTFLLLLRSGEPQESAFTSAFDMSLDAFEADLNRNLKKVSRSW